MQIFILSHDPRKAARQLSDKHVVKMVLETAQLLSAAHHKTNSKYADEVYKLTHTNHPCSVWIRRSKANYRWAYDHFVALCEEYTYRYNKIHLTDSKLREILSNVPEQIPDEGLTEFAQAFPDKYKHSDPVIAYRQYYVGEKLEFARWTKRAIPLWVQDMRQTTRQMKV